MQWGQASISQVNQALVWNFKILSVEMESSAPAIFTNLSGTCHLIFLPSYLGNGTLADCSFFCFFNAMVTVLGKKISYLVMPLVKHLYYDLWILYFWSFCPFWIFYPIVLLKMIVYNMLQKRQILYWKNYRQ